MTAIALSVIPTNSKKSPNSKLSLEDELARLIARAASFKRKREFALRVGAKGLAYTYYKQFKATMMLIDDLKNEIRNSYA